MKAARTLRDPRLLIGILLIVASVAAGIYLVDGAKKGTPYYTLKRDIAIGQPITTADLDVSVANLPAGIYLEQGKMPAGGFAARSLTKGEMLPKTAVTTRNPAEQTLVIALAQPLPADTRVGDTVALYRAGTDPEAGDAVALSRSATVVSLPVRGQFDNSTRVELAINAADLPAVVGSLGERHVLIGVIAAHAGVKTDAK